MEGFEDALCQVRKAHLGLDLSFIKLEEPVQAAIVPVALKNTEDLFVEDANVGDGETAHAQNVQVQSVVDEAQNPLWRRPISQTISKRMIIQLNNS